MTVEPISAKQPCTPLKAAATGVGVAAVATAGLVAGNKADVFHKVSERIKGNGKVQTFAKKALEHIQNFAKEISPKATSGLQAVKGFAKNIWGGITTVVDRVIKAVSGSLDKLEAKINPDKFAKGAVAVDKKLAKAFSKVAGK